MREIAIVTKKNVKISFAKNMQSGYLTRINCIQIKIILYLITKLYFITIHTFLVNY